MPTRTRTQILARRDLAHAHWQRAIPVEHHQPTLPLELAFRVAAAVAFFGALAQLNCGTPLDVALVTASSAGVIVGALYRLIAHMYGGDLPGILLRGALLVSLTALWLSEAFLLSPAWRYFLMR